MSDTTQDRDELLMWRTLAKLESLAIDKYQRFAPRLALPEKRQLIDVLLGGAPDDSALNASRLGDPIRELLAAAESPGVRETLLIQGFLLERLGQTIYKLLSEHKNISPRTKQMATLGLKTCTTALERGREEVKKTIGEGETLFHAFVEVTEAVLKKLDAVGTAVDEELGERLGLTFTEVLGDFTAELLPACVELGINRRQMVCHLTSVFMGQ